MSALLLDDVCSFVRRFVALDDNQAVAVTLWAARLGVSESTISRRLREGRIRSSYVGRRRVVRRDDLDAL